jgi:TPR repeat protein
LLQEGKEFPVDAERDLVLLKQAAGDGDLECQVALGRLYAVGVEGAPDPVKAYSWFELAAESGDPFAQAWMGDCCRTGAVDPPDWVSAEWWYRRAAAQNHTGALMILAEALTAAEPNTQETLAEVFGLWLAAASNGNAVAQRKVGMCYLDGRGCPEDPVAAAQWFLLAAEQSDAEAQYELGICYSEGRGVEENAEEAQYWASRAAYQGLVRAAVSD